MSIFDELVEASFLGVGFLQPSSEISGGIKFALNEFVGNNQQSVEPLGVRQRSFSVTAIIQEDTNQSNYKQKRDRLLSVLESQEKGNYSNPFFGIIENVYAVSYSLIEDQTFLGEARFRINFLIDNFDGQPRIEEDTLSIIDKDISDLSSDLEDEINETIVVGSFFPRNVLDLSDKLVSTVTSFEENITLFEVSEELISEFSSQVSDFRSSVFTLANTPEVVGTQISNLMTTVNNLYNTPNDAFEVLNSFFDFGSEDHNTPINENTNERIERKRNRDLINSLVQGQALIFAYQNFGRLSIQTVDELEQLNLDLENQYFKFLEENVLSEDFISSLSDIRSSVNNFFNIRRNELNEVFEVEINQQPLAVLTYSYYGSTEKFSDLIDLNRDLNVSFFSGKVKLFKDE